MKLLQLEAQPDFPRHDISPQSADIITLPLLNATWTKEVHRQIEAVTPFYRLSHTALRAVAMERFTSPQVNAFSHGVALYEATASLVRPHVISEIDPHTLQTILQTIVFTDKDFVLDILADAHAKMHRQLPHMTQVLGEVASRFHAMEHSYVLAGGAMAYRLEMATLAA